MKPALLVLLFLSCTLSGCAHPPRLNWWIHGESNTLPKSPTYDKNAKPFAGKIILKEKAPKEDFEPDEPWGTPPREKTEYRYTVILDADGKKVFAYSDFSYSTGSCVDVFMRFDSVKGITDRHCQGQ